MKKLFLLCFILVFAVGCSDNHYTDDEIYIVQQNTSNADSIVGWLDVEGATGFDNAQTKSDGIVVSVADGVEYILAPSEYTYSGPVVLKGNIGCCMDLHAYQADTGEKYPIVINVGFIYKVAWNSDQSRLGILTNYEVIIYDKTSQSVTKIALEEKITDFFWSPIDQDKLYLEQNNDYGGYVYSVNTQKALPLYESKEMLYYREYLDDGLYYADQVIRSANNSAMGKLQTVLVNEKGEVIKIIGDGRYKDSYLKHILLTGDNGFGLYYIDDVNYPEKAITLSNEYIYYASFTAEGNILYVVDNSLDKDEFKLILSDGYGNILMEELTDSWGVVITSDGTYAYNTEGFDNELQLNQYDLINSTLVKQMPAGADNRFDNEMVGWLKEVAVLYTKEQMGIEIDQVALEKNFSTNNALAELEDKETSRAKVEKYMITANCKINTSGETVLCDMELFGISNTGMQYNQNVKWLIKEVDGEWMIQETME